MQIEPLTQDTFPLLAALFEEGGDPRWCWCVYFRFRGRDWSNSTAAENRAALESLSERALAPGLVGYRDGRAVGWVSLGPREDYDRLSHSKILAPVDDTPVWSIVCFVVSRKVRGQGVAANLLSAAIDFARAHGATTLEAYPVDTSDGRVPAADAFHGTLTMFERAGFTVVERRQWNPTTPVRPIVRLELDPDEVKRSGAKTSRATESAAVPMPPDRDSSSFLRLACVRGSRSSRRNPAFPCVRHSRPKRSRWG